MNCTEAAATNTNYNMWCTHDTTPPNNVCCTHLSEWHLSLHSKFSFQQTESTPSFVSCCCAPQTFPTSWAQSELRQQLLWKTAGSRHGSPGVVFKQWVIKRWCLTFMTSGDSNGVGGYKFLIRRECACIITLTISCRTFLNFISGLDFLNFDSIEEKTLVWIYWLTLTALLPTWGSRWFVSGMAELLSGRRGYVTGAADNTWVRELRAERMAWITERETARSLQPTASALGGQRGSIYHRGTGDTSLFCEIIYERKHFLYSSYGVRGLTFEMLPISRETAEYSHRFQQTQVSTMAEMTGPWDETVK